MYLVIYLLSVSGAARQKARGPEPALPLPGGSLSGDRASPHLGAGGLCPQEPSSAQFTCARAVLGACTWYHEQLR